MVSKTIELLSHDMDPNVKVQIDLAPELPMVRVDAERLKQVLINLVRNAEQAMGERGGTLTLRTRKEKKPHNPEGLEVLITVQDTGEGIVPEILDHLFVPFFSTKAKGTGLGLAISQRIVQEAGGRLEVKSKPEEGSSFVIRLPAVDPVSTRRLDDQAADTLRPAENSAPRPQHT